MGEVLVMQKYSPGLSIYTLFLIYLRLFWVSGGLIYYIIQQPAFCVLTRLTGNRLYAYWSFMISLVLTYRFRSISCSRSTTRHVDDAPSKQKKLVWKTKSTVLYQDVNALLHSCVYDILKCYSEWKPHWVGWKFGPTTVGIELKTSG